MADGKARVVDLRQIIVELRHLKFILEALEVEVLEGFNREGTRSSSHLKASTLIATGEHTGGGEAR